jgi:hypothetical protein
MYTANTPEHIATIIDNETSYLFRIINSKDFSFHFLKFNDTLCTYLYMDQIFGIKSVLYNPMIFIDEYAYPMIIVHEYAYPIGSIYG